MAHTVFIVFLLTAVSFAYANDSCGDNESISICGRLCEPTCTNRTPNPIACPAFCTNSTRACRCKNGYYRDNQTDLCVPAEMCPETRGSRRSRQVKPCQPNEIMAPCGTLCEGTCRSPRTPDICKNRKCEKQGCRCDLDKGFVRSPRLRCSRLEDCFK